MYFLKKLRARKALKKKQIITIMLWINTLNLQFTNVFVLLFFFKPTKKPKKKLYTRAFSIIARVPRHVFFFFKRKDHMLYVLFVFFFHVIRFLLVARKLEVCFFLLKTYFQLIFFYL